MSPHSLLLAVTILLGGNGAAATATATLAFTTGTRCCSPTQISQSRPSSPSRTLSSPTAIAASPSGGDGDGDDVTVTGSRRHFLEKLSKVTTTASIFAVGSSSSSSSTTTFATVTVANALDFDAFEKGLVDRDTQECDPKLDRKCIPKLTPDEALCKYGVSGSDARTAACRRVRDAGGALPSSKPGERSTMGWLNNPIAL